MPPTICLLLDAASFADMRHADTRHAFIACHYFAKRAIYEDAPAAAAAAAIMPLRLAPAESATMPISARWG